MAKTPGRGCALPTTKRKRRKSVRYSQRVAEKILERLAEGGAWEAICREKGMPSYRTLYNWRRRSADFDAAVRLAQEMGAEWRADRAVAVTEATTPATVSADRLRFDALKWRASRIGPKAQAPAEAAEARPTRLVIHVKQFERAVRPDGTTYIREVLPKGRRR